jgi:hypothetical protein
LESHLRWSATLLEFHGHTHKNKEHAVAQLVEAPRYKPEGLITDGVIGIFH